MPEPLDAFRETVEGRAEEEGQVFVPLRAHLAAELVAAHARHPDVGDDELRPMAFDARQGFAAAARRVHGEAGAPQMEREELQDVLVVVDEQHVGHGRGPVRRAGRMP